MNKYTLKDIETLWKDYETKKILRILKGGKWKTIPLKGSGIPHVAATQAKVVKVMDVMSFPKYLKKIEDAKTT